MGAHCLQQKNQVDRYTSYIRPHHHRYQENISRVALVLDWNSFQAQHTIEVLVVILKWNGRFWVDFRIGNREVGDRGRGIQALSVKFKNMQQGRGREGFGYQQRRGSWVVNIRPVRGFGC